MARFDWPGLMRLGLGQLKLRPEQFWALTPAELQLMLGQGAGAGGGPMGRAGLAALLERYPDGPGSGDAGESADEERVSDE